MCIDIHGPPRWLVKNLFASVGDMGSICDPGRPHMPCTTTTESVLYSRRATATEPTCCSCWSLCAQSPNELCNEKPLQWEDRALQLQSSLCSLQLRKMLAQKQRPSTAKNNITHSIQWFFFKKRNIKEKNHKQQLWKYIITSQKEKSPNCQENI